MTLNFIVEKWKKGGTNRMSGNFFLGCTSSEVLKWRAQKLENFSKKVAIYMRREMLKERAHRSFKPPS